MIEQLKRKTNSEFPSLCLLDNSVQNTFEVRKN